MPTIRLTPEQVTMYYRPYNPIMTFLLEKVGDPDGGKNWWFNRVKGPVLRMDDALNFNPEIDLFIADPEVATLFKLTFSGV